jgi:hypothetical protein
MYIIVEFVIVAFLLYVTVIVGLLLLAFFCRKARILPKLVNCIKQGQLGARS